MESKSNGALRFENGIEAEIQAQRYLEGFYEVVERVNALIDFVVDHNQPVEVKSCQARIKRCDAKRRSKNGRFKLKLTQHTYLLENNGLYLFVVSYEDKRSRILLMPAKLLPFQKQYSWYRVFHGGFFNGL